MTNKRRRPKTLVLSLISTFAALNIIAGFLPFTPVLGVPGAYFRLGWVLAPLTGILLGPVAGGVSCILASLVELFLGLQSWSFGVFSPFRAGLTAFQSGLLARGRWKMALAILGLLISSWVLLPSGREALMVLSFPLLGFFLILFFRSKIGRYVDSLVWGKAALGVAVASYCGNISRHLLGNTLLVLITDVSSIVFISAIPLTLIEQASFTATSTILGVALARTRLREFADSYWS